MVRRRPSAGLRRVHAPVCPDQIKSFLGAAGVADVERNLFRETAGAGAEDSSADGLDNRAFLSPRHRPDNRFAVGALNMSSSASSSSSTSTVPVPAPAAAKHPVWVGPLLGLLAGALGGARQSTLFQTSPSTDILPSAAFRLLFPPFF